MRVALVHMRQREVGGTERYQNQLARYLAEQGDEVTIVCRSHEEPPHPRVRFATLRPPSIGGAWRMWAFANAVEGHVSVHSYDVVFGLGKTWTHDVVRLGGGLHQTYLDLAYDATQRAWPKMWGGVSLKHRLALQIEKRALTPTAARRVITNSEMVKRDVMQRYALAENRVVVVYNGVDIHRFHPRLRPGPGAQLRAACGFASEDIVILFLGTEYGRKGLRRVLDAFPALLRERPRCRLLVVGYDSRRAQYEAEARPLRDRVRFLGGRRDAEACFAAADLYVLPTLYDPFANSTLEALSAGVPIITTTTNGASELITPRVEGSVVEASGAPERLRDELLFWADPERLRTGSIAARTLAERHTDIDTASATRTVLETVCREKEVERSRGRDVGARR